MKTLLVTCLFALAITARAADIKQRPASMQPQVIQPESVSTPVKAMICSQCATITRVSQRNLGGKPGFPQPPVIIRIHQCPGCRDTFARKFGTKTLEMAHTCTVLGEKALCCATVPGVSHTGTAIR
jgi:hypothetical protein